MRRSSNPCEMAGMATNATAIRRCRSQIRVKSPPGRPDVAVLRAGCVDTPCHSPGKTAGSGVPKLEQVLPAVRERLSTGGCAENQIAVKNGMRRHDCAGQSGMCSGGKAGRLGLIQRRIRRNDGDRCVGVRR